MKTRNFLFAFALVVATATSSFAGKTSTMLINSTDALKNSFREIIQSDFDQQSDFMFDNNVDRLDDRVQVEFYISQDKEIRILDLKSKYSVGSEYIKQLLNKEKINVTPEMVGKKYRINIKLIYRAA